MDLGSTIQALNQIDGVYVRILSKLSIGPIETMAEPSS